MKIINKIVILSLLLVTITGCNKANDIDKVKKGKLDSCPNYTISELIDNYMEDPKWESQKSDKGYYVYNVSGKILYNDERVEALIQFATSGSKIIVKDFEIDKISEKKILLDNLILDMCKVTKEKNKSDKDTVNIPKEIEEKISNIQEDYTVFDLLVNKMTSYGNSIYPGNHIDLYEIDNNNNPKLILENVEVIATRTKNNSYDFSDVSKEKEWYLLIVIPKEMEAELKYLKIYPAPTSTRIYFE